MTVLSFILAVLLLARPAGADDAQQQPSVADFAYGRDIQITSPGPLQTVLLDLRVYRGSVEPHLADLRVFNGAGESVPHAIRQLASGKAAQRERVAAPLFRLPAAQPDTAVATADGERTYAINAKLLENGAILSVTSTPADGAATPSALPAAYLVDSSQIDKHITGLELTLGNGSEDFVTPLRVEASDDLVRFRSVAETAALARLDQSGHRIEINDAEILPGRYRYLRLSSARGKLPEILAAHALLAPSAETPPRDNTRVTGSRVDGEAGAFVFDLGGAIPVDQVQIDLPDANTLVEAQLFSATSGDGPWIGRYSGVLFDLRGATRLRNPPIPFTANRNSHVKLTTSAKGGGIGTGTPDLEASWYPEQLLFITRGEPPYLLRYGRAGVGGSRFDAAQLLAITQTPSDEVPRATAGLGDEYGVAPETVLTPTVRAVSRRTMALWAVLVLSVVVALTLSLRLSRQMRQET